MESSKNLDPRFTKKNNKKIKSKKEYSNLKTKLDFIPWINLFIINLFIIIFILNLLPFILLINYSFLNSYYFGLLISSCFVLLTNLISMLILKLLIKKESSYLWYSSLNFMLVLFLNGLFFGMVLLLNFYVKDDIVNGMFNVPFYLIGFAITWLLSWFIGYSKTNYLLINF